MMDMYIAQRMPRRIALAKPPRKSARGRNRPRQRSLDLGRKCQTKRATVVATLRQNASRSAPELFQKNDWLELNRVHQPAGRVAGRQQETRRRKQNQAGVEL